jgi:hypothetical protein
MPQNMHRPQPTTPVHFGNKSNADAIENGPSSLSPGSSSEFASRFAVNYPASATNRPANYYNNPNFLHQPTQQPPHHLHQHHHQHHQQPSFHAQMGRNSTPYYYYYLNNFNNSNNFSMNTNNRGVSASAAANQQQQQQQQRNSDDSGNLAGNMKRHSVQVINL